MLRKSEDVSVSGAEGRDKTAIFDALEKGRDRKLEDLNSCLAPSH